jgi:hypothetical protein
LGEKKSIKWKYGEVREAVALNNEDKLILSCDKGFFIVDVKVKMFKKFSQAGRTPLWQTGILNLCARSAL